LRVANLVIWCNKTWRILKFALVGAGNLLSYGRQCSGVSFTRFSSNVANNCKAVPFPMRGYLRRVIYTTEYFLQCCLFRRNWSYVKWSVGFRAQCKTDAVYHVEESEMRRVSLTGARAIL
jgi:hypothetical protein